MLSLLIIALAVSMSVVGSDSPEIQYRLDTGDRVRVTVYGHPDLSGELEIDSAGRISMPLIQQVDAAGLTLIELETAVANKLRPDYLKNPRVSVEVLAYRPFYIFGEINAPGSYPYINGMTVVNAIAVAGGFTYRAHTRKFVIVRGTGTKRPRISASQDTIVLPGDVVEVEERFF